MHYSFIKGAPALGLTGTECNLRKIYLEIAREMAVSSNQPRIPSVVRAFLIDLDGVLYMGKNPIPGVKECLQRMSELGYGYRFVSNSTRRCRSSVSERLQGLGYSVPARHIYTPPLAAIEKHEEIRKREMLPSHRRRRAQGF